MLASPGARAVLLCWGWGLSQLREERCWGAGAEDWGRPETVPQLGSLSKAVHGHRRLSTAPGDSGRKHCLSVSWFGFYLLPPKDNEYKQPRPVQEQVSVKAKRCSLDGGRFLDPGR